jgi:hypothetical protein
MDAPNACRLDVRTITNRRLNTQLIALLLTKFWRNVIFEAISLCMPSMRALHAVGVGARQVQALDASAHVHPAFNVYHMQLLRSHRLGVYCYTA